MIYLKKLLHILYINKQKKYLKNKNFSIISNNCIAGVIYNDLNLKFSSPTINLFIKPTDFIKLCMNLKWYMTQEIIEIHEEKINYPIGLCHDIKIYFMHYKTFQEAYDAWKRRCKRINYDDIFIIMVQRDGFNRNDLRLFDKINYPKILFTNEDYKKKNTFYIKGFENDKYLGNIITYDKNKLFKRYYEQYDIISFLNGDKNL